MGESERLLTPSGFFVSLLYDVMVDFLLEGLHSCWYNYTWTLLSARHAVVHAQPFDEAVCVIPLRQIHHLRTSVISLKEISLLYNILATLHESSDSIPRTCISLSIWLGIYIILCPDFLPLPDPGATRHKK